MMVWFQIMLFSLAAGLMLFFTNKTDKSKVRNLYYLIFIIIFSVLITTAFALQARIDTSNIVFGFILPSMIISIILCIEAIFVSKVINKYINVVNIFLYLPIFIIVLWVVYFITLTIIISFYPGS